MSIHPAYQSANIDFDNPWVDLRQHPPYRRPYTLPHNQVTAGDFHANADKLDYFLARENIFVRRNLYDRRRIHAMYQEAAAHVLPDPNDDEKDILYPGIPLTRADFEEVIEILEQTEINPCLGDDFILRFLGDLIGDRGANDMLMFLYFQALQGGVSGNKKKIEIEKLLGNHDLEVILALEAEAASKDGFVNYKSKMDLDTHPGQVNSLKALQESIRTGEISIAEVRAFAEQYYLPNVKAFSYTIRDDLAFKPGPGEKQRKIIDIYSHAPVGLETIHGVANKLGVAYKDESAEALGETIDRINDAFQAHVRAGTVHNLYQDCKNPLDIEEDDPFYWLLWRRQEDVDVPIYRPEEIQSSPTEQPYRLFFINGHDGKVGPGDTPNSLILNNSLGKFKNCEGEDGVVRSRGISRVLDLKNKQTLEEKVQPPVAPPIKTEPSQQPIVKNLPPPAPIPIPMEQEEESVLLKTINFEEMTPVKKSGGSFWNFWRCCSAEKPPTPKPTRTHLPKKGGPS